LRFYSRRLSGRVMGAEFAGRTRPSADSWSSSEMSAGTGKRIAHWVRDGSSPRPTSLPAPCLGGSRGRLLWGTRRPPRNPGSARDLRQGSLGPRPIETRAVSVLGGRRPVKRHPIRAGAGAPAKGPQLRPAAEPHLGSGGLSTGIALGVAVRPEPAGLRLASPTTAWTCSRCASWVPSLRRTWLW